jgi:hypothetical protein
MISGQALFVQMSSVATKVSSGVFRVGTSATQFPASAGITHQFGLQTSNMMYIGGTAAGANSGVGFLLQGDPTTSIMAWLDRIEISNLNLLWGKMVAVSGWVTFISYNK